MKGYIYILTNSSMPGLVKIGKTSRSPQVRAKEISRGTGIPTPFVVAHARRVRDMNSAERAIHQALDGNRTNNRREFFQIDLNKAKRMTDKICDRHGGVMTADQPTSIPIRILYAVLVVGLFMIDAFLILSILSLKMGTPNAVKQIGTEWAISFGVVAVLTVIGFLFGRNGRRLLTVVFTLLLTFIVAFVLYFV